MSTGFAQHQLSGPHDDDKTEEAAYRPCQCKSCLGNRANEPPKSKPVNEENGISDSGEEDTYYYSSGSEDADSSNTVADAATNETAPTENLPDALAGLTKWAKHSKAEISSSPAMWQALAHLWLALQRGNHGLDNNKATRSGGPTVLATSSRSIQAAMRGMLARRPFLARRKIAAPRIQAAMRGMLARRFRRERIEAIAVSEHSIQAAMRGMLDRRQCKKEALAVALAVAKKQLADLVKDSNARAAEKQRKRAAIVIQRIFRGRLGRKKCALLQRNNAIAVLRASVFSLISRRKVKQQLLLAVSARSIQTAMRGMLARRPFLARRKKEVLKEKEAADRKETARAEYEALLARNSCMVNLHDGSGPGGEYGHAGRARENYMYGMRSH